MHVPVNWARLLLTFSLRRRLVNWLHSLIGIYTFDILFAPPFYLPTSRARRARTYLSGYYIEDSTDDATRSP